MTLTSSERSRLRKQANSLPIVAQVGKAGLSGPVVEEVRRQLAEKRLVKVRLLDSSGDDAKATAERLAESLGAELVEVRGSTAVLWRARAGQA